MPLQQHAGIRVGLGVHLRALLLGGLALQEFARHLDAGAYAGGDHAINDCRRQFIRPVIDGLNRDAYGASRIPHASAEVVNGFLLFHTAIKAYFTSKRKISLSHFARMLV